jgi:hypothetical protein
VALSQLGLNFACRHCHIEDGEASPKTDEELMEAANDIAQWLQPRHLKISPIYRDYRSRVVWPG